MVQRFSIYDDFEAAYRRDGYVIIDDLFSREEVEGARDEIVNLFRSRFADDGRAHDARDELLVRYYDEAKPQWRECATRMQDLIAPASLAVKPAVKAALSRAGIVAPLMGTRPEVRTDMPADQQYMQPWHQDWRSGQGSINSVTIWVPLHDVTADNGAIELLPGSHLLGYCDVEELQNPRRFQVVDPRIDDWGESVVAELDAGEAALFSQLLVHRSGYNSTSSPRITLQLRYSDYAEPAFAARGYPRPTGSELVWDAAPTAADVEAALVGELRA